MATTTAIPVSQYLATTWRPDRDYLDGELKERNMGERPHSVIQGFFAGLFFVNRRSWPAYALPEQRVQVSPTSYRVADVCIVRASDPPDPIVSLPPLACIEILSRNQTLADLQPRIDDYLTLGVPHIWLVDPILRRAWTADSSGLHVLTTAFTVPGTPIHIPLASLYAELDEIAAGL